MKVRFCIVGCGLIGKKRAIALKELGESVELVSISDIDPKKMDEVEGAYGKSVAKKTDPSDAMKENVHAAIVATYNASLVPISKEALELGRYVLVEKPGGTSVAELETLNSLGKSSHVRLGYNHRYHGAFIKIRDILGDNDFGKLMFIRARYGHGGRLGYDKEWRFDKALSGGGELIDQGVHIVDLAQSFMAPIKGARGSLHSYFWNGPAEDNSFVEMRDTQGATAWLHASCTEWKNLFSFEIYFERAKFAVEGLGGSYGTEKLYFYKMLPQMGPPETEVFEFGADESWRLEILDFLNDIKLKKIPRPGIEEGLNVLRVVDKLYSSGDWV